MELLRVMVMPFQWGSLLFVGLSSALLAFVLQSTHPAMIVLGLFIYWICLVWLTRYAFQMIDDAANGVREAAAADIGMTNPLGDARCWVHPILALLLYLLHYWQPQIPVPAILGAATLLFPPSIAACAMSGRALDAVNPLAIAAVVRGLGAWYLVTVLVAAGCATLAVLLIREMALGWPLFVAVQLLVLIAYAGIGGAVHLRRIELGFAPRVSPERRAEAAQRERAVLRQKLLDELYLQLRAHDSPHALEATWRWLRQAQPGELHDDVHAMLDAGRRWNEPREYVRLLKGLLPLLLEKRQPALALTACDAALATDAGFAPEQEGTTVALIEYSIQTGRRRSSARLLDNALAALQGAAPSPRLAELATRLRAGG